MSRLRYRLRLLQNVHHLPQGGQVLLGRGDGCHVVLDGDLVSREHVRIEVNGDRVVLHDLGSLNGTYVNDRRVKDPVLLRHGDRIRVAFFSLQFESEENTQKGRTTMQLVYCGSCQAALTTNMKFCVHCGAEVAGSAASSGCYMCGVAMTPGVTECANCGHENTRNIPRSAPLRS